MEKRTGEIIMGLFGKKGAQTSIFDPQEKEPAPSPTAMELMMNAQQNAFGQGLGSQLMNAQQAYNHLAGMVGNAPTPYANPPVSGVKYKQFSFRVNEISNGYVVVCGSESYFCEDLKAVGERITAICVAETIK